MAKTNKPADKSVSETNRPQDNATATAEPETETVAAATDALQNLPEGEEAEAAAPAAAEPAPEPQSAEIANLEGAVEQVQSSIEAIDQEILDYEAKIEECQQRKATREAALREHLGKLLSKFRQNGESTKPAKKVGRPAGKKSAAATTIKVKVKSKTAKPAKKAASGDAQSTRELILECLSLNKTKKRAVVPGKEIEAYVTDQGGSGNPSVELSRLVSKGEISRPSRGMYSLS